MRVCALNKFPLRDENGYQFYDMGFVNVCYKVVLTELIYYQHSGLIDVEGCLAF